MDEFTQVRILKALFSKNTSKKILEILIVSKNEHWNKQDTWVHS